MYAGSSIDASQGRWPTVGLSRRSGRIRRVVVILFTVAVEAILVLGFILLTLAPGAAGAAGGHGTGPDRPPAPLAAPLRP